MQTQINRAVLNKLLEDPRIPNWNMMQVINHVYDATYIHYSLKFFSEKAKREEYEQTIVDKVGEVKALTDKIGELEDKISTLTEPPCL